MNGVHQWAPPAGFELSPQLQDERLQQVLRLASSGAIATHDGFQFITADDFVPMPNQVRQQPKFANGQMDRMAVAINRDCTEIDSEITDHEPCLTPTPDQCPGAHHQLFEYKRVCDGVVGTRLERSDSKSGRLTADDDQERDVTVLFPEARDQVSDRMFVRFQAEDCE